MPSPKKNDTGFIGLGSIFLEFKPKSNHYFIVAI